MSKEKTIHNLDLHETLKVKSDLFVTRVYGGWVYNFVDEAKNSYVFVPDSSEFQRFKNVNNLD